MKKVFKLTDEKKKPERLLEAIKHDLKKYMKRERSKKLPDDATFWDFACKFGPSADKAESLTVLELNKALDAAVEAKETECYVEVIAKAISKPKADKND